MWFWRMGARKVENGAGVGGGDWMDGYCLAHAELLLITSRL